MWRVGRIRYDEYGHEGTRGQNQIADIMAEVSPLIFGTLTIIPLLVKAGAGRIIKVEGDICVGTSCS